MSDFDVDGFGPIKSFKGEPGDAPPWYQQLLKIDPKKKSKIVDEVLQLLKKKKPEMYDFINKEKCVLVGFMPIVSYNLPGSKKEEADVTWMHSFAVPTLLYWHPKGEFGFFVNPVLKYNDSILNHVSGNKKQGILGFTG